MKMLVLEPCSPWKNGYEESFDGELRDELLARALFDTLRETEVLIERRRKACCTVRPHRSLGCRSPAGIVDSQCRPRNQWVSERHFPKSDPVSRQAVARGGNR
jgi:hypothetical protein